MTEKTAIIHNKSVLLIEDAKYTDKSTRLVHADETAFKLEPSSNPAVNQYGYIEYPSWEAAVADQCVIFVSEDGQPYIDAHRS